jgi:hypothetical protein
MSKFEESVDQSKSNLFRDSNIKNPKHTIYIPEFTKNCPKLLVMKYVIFWNEKRFTRIFIEFLQHFTREICENLHFTGFF